MASKTYTAQEMREEANKVTRYDCYVASDMLRQAADMIERCVKARSRHSLYYGKLDYEDETEIVNEIDYIIHGDTRKEHDDVE